MDSFTGNTPAALMVAADEFLSAAKTGGPMLNFARTMAIAAMDWSVIQSAPAYDNLRIAVRCFAMAARIDRAHA